MLCTSMNEAQKSIDELVGSFFGCFDNRKNRMPDFDFFNKHFLTDSVIGNKTESGVSTWSLNEFWQPRKELLTSGRLVEFHEWETESNTAIYHGIANRQSTYQKEGVLDGLPYSGEGIKLFQLVLTHGGWRIAYLLWEDLTEAHNKTL